MSEPPDGAAQPTTVLCPDCGDLGTYPSAEARERARAHLQHHREVADGIDALFGDA